MVERGEYPGAKNVTGGRLYLNPVRPYFPAGFFDDADDAPLERPVVKERLTMLAEDASTTVELQAGALRAQPWHSATVLRGRLDRWLADRVQERGPLIIPRYRVDELVLQDGRVAGIRAAGEEILADVTVLADGALSILAEQAGLRGKQDPHHFAVGFKEVIELPARAIEDRFGVAEGQGAAQLFFGSVSKGLFGGGFLYTNQQSVSLGMVLGIGGLAAAEPPVEAYLLLDELKARPEVAPLIAGGVSVEYSAHVIPEGGLAALPTLAGAGRAGGRRRGGPGPESGHHRAGHGLRPHLRRAGGTGHPAGQRSRRLLGGWPGRLRGSPARERGAQGPHHLQARPEGAGQSAALHPLPAGRVPGLPAADVDRRGAQGEALVHGHPRRLAGLRQPGHAARRLGLLRM